MKTIKIMIFIITVMIAITTVAVSENARAKQEKKMEMKQNICPVMGGEVSKDIYYDYEGKRIYFCCQGCVEAFKADPEKYMTKMKKEGVTLEGAPMLQDICPVSGKKINREIFTDQDGKRIYFCCSNCVAEFKKDPEKYIKKLEEKGYTFDKIPEKEEDR